MECFFEYRDAALYALGVGACGTNAVDANELKYVYHGDGQQFIKVLIIPFPCMTFVRFISLVVAKCLLSCISFLFNDIRL